MNKFKIKQYTASKLLNIGNTILRRYSDTGVLCPENNDFNYNHLIYAKMINDIESLLVMDKFSFTESLDKNFQNDINFVDFEMAIVITTGLILWKKDDKLRTILNSFEHDCCFKLDNIPLYFENDLKHKFGLYADYKSVICCDIEKIEKFIIDRAIELNLLDRIKPIKKRDEILIG